ncbi:MAG: nitroreductase family protein [Proteobacteria bacterium]|nr:nitroreductase family protein [Pseudomonadota bacterium]
MPLFTWIGRDGPDGLAGRGQHREAHLANLRPLVAQGRVRYAGPLLGEDGDPTGSVIVFEADDLESARAFAGSDPYVSRGIFASHEIFETRQVFGTVGAIEAMESCRAIRYLKPDPVPDALIERVLYAATRASNPGNSQGWEFLVVRDADLKRELRDAVAGAMREGMRGALDQDVSASQRRVMEGAVHLCETLDRVPVIVLVCARNTYPPQQPNELFVWSAVYPASQNLIVAARELGLGTTFTTLHFLAEERFREILGVPDDVYLGTVIPMGYPERPFGPLARRPLDGIVHYDRW